MIFRTHCSMHKNNDWATTRGILRMAQGTFTSLQEIKVKVSMKDRGDKKRGQMMEVLNVIQSRIGKSVEENRKKRDIL